jgi:PAS domain S-box-containing protein
MFEAPVQQTRMASKRDPAARHVFWGGLILIAITIATAFLAVWELHEDRVAGATSDAKDLSVLLAEQAARTIQAVDLVVRETSAMVTAAGVVDPDQFRRAMATENIHHFLVDRLRSLPQANSIALLDDTGRIVNFSHAWPVPFIDASDRDFYRYLRDHDDTEVFVGAPVVNRFTGAWTLMLARRINGPRDEFLGIAVGVVAARYFEDFYRAVSTNTGESIALFRRDGTMLARYPHIEEMVGNKISSQSPWYAAVAAGGGTYRTPGYVGGVPRIISVKPTPEYPLAVTVGAAEDVVLAPWRRQAFIIAVGTLCALTGFIVLFRALAAQFRRLERRSSELAQSEDRFRDFAITSSDWFWETDANHIVTYVSEGIRAFGQDPNSRIGRNRIEIAASFDQDRAKWDEHLAALNRHEPFRDFIFTAQVGEQPGHTVSIGGKPFFDAGGCFLGYRGTGRDITAQIDAERRLRDAKEEAEAANRSKSQFLANMSHELRTPLNAILGFSEMLECGMAGPLEARQHEYAGLIHESGQHLLTIINDILDLARVDAGKLELHEESGIDPHELAATCVTLVKARAAAGGLRLSTMSEDGLPCIAADATRLKQILLNLLSNAIKFTEPGGSVSLTMRRATDGGIAFDVSDTGQGMTADEIIVALEPFGQIDSGHNRRHEGTGLGLPLARQLAALHGGSLEIRSEKGEGTTVTVTLPPGRAVTNIAAKATTGATSDAS